MASPRAPIELDLHDWQHDMLTAYVNKHGGSLNGWLVDWITRGVMRDDRKLFEMHTRHGAIAIYDDDPAGAEPPEG